MRQNPISPDSENDDLILDHAQRSPGVQSGEQGLEEPHARKELKREPPGGGSRPLLAASSCKELLLSSHGSSQRQGKMNGCVL